MLGNQSRVTTMRMARKEQLPGGSSRCFDKVIQGVWQVTNNDSRRVYLRPKAWGQRRKKRNMGDGESSRQMHKTPWFTWKQTSIK